MGISARITRARREVMLLCALSACTAFAEVTVDAVAETPNVPSFTAGDPAIGTRVIGTDTTMNGLYAYAQNGTALQSITVGLNGAADVRDGLLAVTFPNIGILFFHESTLVETTLPDGGYPTINLPGVSMVALGSDVSLSTLVFANGGGTSVYEFAYGSTAPISSVTLPSPPRGLAWFEGKLYATIDGAVISAVGTQMETVISDNVGAAEGITVDKIGDDTFAFIASSSDSSIYVHRLSSPAEFIGKFTLKNNTTTVKPRYLASNGTTMVVQDSLTANYKIVYLTGVAAAFGLSVGVTLDGGVIVIDGGSGGGGGHSGVGGPGPGLGGGGGEPLPLCGCSAPPFLLVPALLLLMLRRKFRR